VLLISYYITKHDNHTRTGRHAHRALIRRQIQMHLCMTKRPCYQPLNRH